MYMFDIIVIRTVRYYCSEGGIVFSSVHLCVCLSVNSVTRGTLRDIITNFQGIILWLKGWTGLKLAV